MPILNLVLQSRGSSGTLLPWVQVVMNDILVLKGALRPKLDDLDSPLEDPHWWINLIVEYPKQWKAIVASYHDSCDDIDARQHADSKPYSDSLLVFTCNTCGSVFATNKQLAQHSRIKHKMICVAARCLPDVSVCPICSNDYHSRTALVTHLSDLRVRSKTRGTCCGLEYINSNPAPLSEDTLLSLTEADNQLRKRARVNSHSHHIQSKPCVIARKKSDAGIPRELLPLLDINGCSRRLTCKTSSRIAFLRFKVG